MLDCGGAPENEKVLELSKIKDPPTNWIPDQLMETLLKEENTPFMYVLRNAAVKASACCCQRKKSRARTRARALDKHYSIVHEVRAHVVITYHWLCVDVRRCYGYTCDDHSRIRGVRIPWCSSSWRPCLFMVVLAYFFLAVWRFRKTGLSAKSGDEEDKEKLHDLNVFYWGEFEMNR